MQTSVPKGHSDIYETYTTAIIAEVGGVVSDMHGNTIDWTAPHVSYLCARTLEIHTQLLELLNK